MVTIDLSKDDNLCEVCDNQAVVLAVLEAPYVGTAYLCIVHNAEYGLK